MTAPLRPAEAVSAISARLGYGGKGPGVSTPVRDGSAPLAVQAELLPDIPVPPAVVDGQPVTERTMLDLLHDRYSFVSHNGGVRKPRWVCAEHVRERAGFDCRTLDFVAVDTWASGKLATHGVEIKVSRSDWLRELKQPAKAAPFLEWTTHFWLAVPNPGVAKEGELPPGWGMLVIRGSGTGIRLAVLLTPPRRQAAPIPPEAMASLLYAVQKTASRRAAS